MIDVGAHHGWFSRLMALSHPTANVFAFEPDPKSFEFLDANVSEFRNVRCFNSAVGATSGHATLWRGQPSDLNSTVRQVGKPIVITMSTVDCFCASQGLDSVDLVKCDVEGGEVNVLRGSIKVLRSTQPPIWMLEISEAFLTEAGTSADELTALLCRARRGAFFSQTADGRPIEIQKLADRIIGNNVFFVPDCRLQQFHHAAGQIRS